MRAQEIYGELGRIIASRRKRLGLSQAEVARRTGISRPSLANIEVGRQRVLVHQLYALANALELEDARKLLPLAVALPSGGELPTPDVDLTPSQRAQIERLYQSVPTRQRDR